MERVLRVTLQSLVDEWTRMVKAAPVNVRLVSPYLTDPIANRIVGQADPATCIVITRFRLEDFAASASSLDAIDRLLRRKVRVLYLRKLHAKVLLTDRQATIGSQNTTAGSQFNIEAGAILTDDVNIQMVRGWVGDLVVQADPVSAQMVGDARKVLRELSKTFARFVEQADQHQEELLRLEERRKLAAARRLAISRTRTIEQQLSIEPNVSSVNRVRLVTIDPSHDRRRMSWDFSPSYVTMKSRGDNLLKWTFPDGQTQSLFSTSRYLLLDAVTRRLGWVRVHKTQLTKIGTGIELGRLEEVVERLKLDLDDAAAYARHSPLNVAINLPAPTDSVNVVLALSSATTKLEYKFRFDLAQCRLVQVARSNIAFLDESSRHVIQQLTKLARNGELGVRISAEITSMFSYKHNSNGIHPSSFFSSPWQQPPRGLKLVERPHGQKIIVALR